MAREIISSSSNSELPMELVMGCYYYCDFVEAVYWAR